MDGLLHAGVSNAVAAGLMALVLLPLARLLRRPALTHALCVLVLLKLVTPPLVSIPVPWPSAAPAGPPALWPGPSVREPQVATAAPPTAVRGAAVVVITPSDESPSLAGPPTAPELELPHEYDGPAVAAAVDPTAATSAPARAVAVPPPPVGADRAGVDWARLLGLAWAATSCLCAAVIAVRLAALTRAIRSASPAPADVRDQARVLARRLGLADSPPVYFVPGVASPMLLAVFARPRLVLPARLWDRLGPAQRQTLLLHELAHLRRRDHWVRYVELAVAVVYWWHPAAWWVRARLREAEEQCCDAWVVWALPGSARTYMATLLDAMDFLCERPERSERPHPAYPATAVMATGMGQFHCLERRLTMVKEQTVRRRLSAGGLAAVIGAAALVLPLGPGLLARAVAADDPAPKPTTPAPTDPTTETAPAPEKAPATDTAPAAEKAPATDGERLDPFKTGVRSVTEVQVAKDVAADPTVNANRRAEEALRSARDEAADATARERSARDEAEQDRARVKADRDRADKTAEASRDEAAELRKEVADLRALVHKYEELLKAHPDLANPKGPTADAAPKPTQARLASKDGEVVVKAVDGKLSGVDAVSGKLLWTFQNPSDGKAVVVAVAVEGGQVQVKLSDGLEMQFDLKTGRLLSEVKTGHAVGLGKVALGEKAVAANKAPLDPIAAKRGTDQEQRLRALEDRIDNLTRAVERLAESRDGGPRSGNGDKNNGDKKNYVPARP